jgi:hypothetical protein
MLAVIINRNRILQMLQIRHTTANRTSKDREKPKKKVK